VHHTALWCFLLGACEVIHIFACKGEKTAEIVLRILYATIKDVVNEGPRINAPVAYCQY